VLIKNKIEVNTEHSVDVDSLDLDVGLKNKNK
jgi:hypothetical protein